MSDPIRVDVWSDLVCPWCYIGRARLRRVAAEQGIALDLRHRAFQLDPSDRPTEPTVDALRRKYGPSAPQMMANAESIARSEGLPADLLASRSANTRKAHRLCAWAAGTGRGEALVDDLMRQHFAHAADLADDATLAAAAQRVGLDPAAAGAALQEGAHDAEVEEDLALARQVGIRGVPFFVLDGRIGLSGAQPAATFAQALRQAQAPPAPPAA